MEPWKGTAGLWAEKWGVGVLANGRTCWTTTNGSRAWDAQHVVRVNDAVMCLKDAKKRDLKYCHNTHTQTHTPGIMGYGGAVGQRYGDNLVAMSRPVADASCTLT